MTAVTELEFVSVISMENADNFITYYKVNVSLCLHKLYAILFHINICTVEIGLCLGLATAGLDCHRLEKFHHN